jgi:hypothetical protein
LVCLFCAFESEEWPSLEPKPNRSGTRKSTMTHR